jgi:hypothetical protein
MWSSYICYFIWILNDVYKCLKRIENSTIKPYKIIIMDAADNSEFNYQDSLNIEHSYLLFISGNFLNKLSKTK